MAEIRSPGSAYERLLWGKPILKSPTLAAELDPLETLSASRIDSYFPIVNLSIRCGLIHYYCFTQAVKNQLRCR